MLSFDSNVLVYASGPRDDVKADRARALIESAMSAGTAVLLLQTLAEFSNVAIRKSQLPVAAVERFVASWQSVFPVQAAAPEDLGVSLEAVRTAKISFWDAMLWAAAQRAGVRYLFTEDLQDGFVLQRVTFVNPFNAANEMLIERVVSSSI